MTRKKVIPKTIGVLTSGGDSPGMNCAIRATVRTAIYNNLKVKGIWRGYEGLIANDIKDLSLRSVGGIINIGGTFLLTARSDEFRTPEGRKKGAANLKKHGVEGLVVIGGDGSFKGASLLFEEHGVKVIGVPGTIDNDIMGTDYTIGYDTAINTAVEALDKIRDTATSHKRIFVVEVMGRHAGLIALAVGIGGGAEGVLVPEIPFDLQSICERIEKGNKRGKLSDIIVVAEGAGSAMEIAYKINKMLDVKTRAVVIGHLQRGGSPSALDRIMASRMGEEAVNALCRGESGKMVGMVANEIKLCPLSVAWEQKKSIDKDLYELAEILAI